MSEEEKATFTERVKRRLFWDKRPRPPLFAWVEIEGAIEAELRKNSCS